MKAISGLGRINPIGTARSFDRAREALAARQKNAAALNLRPRDAFSADVPNGLRRSLTRLWSSRGAPPAAGAYGRIGCSRQGR